MSKQTTGMALARVLFNQIMAEGYQLTVEGVKSQRGEFIARAITECGLTKAGASTYFQNLKNEAQGKPLYHKKEKASTTFVDVSAAMNASNGPLFDVDEEYVQEKHRWMIVDSADTSVELTSFASRSKAQDFARENGVKWMDRTKIAA